MTRWLALDLALTGVFAALGRWSHHEALTIGGWWHTAWPFLAGVAAGWVVALAARRTPAALGTGLIVWPAAVLGGMLLRRVSDQGTAPAFVVVATLALGLMLLLPRTVVFARSRALAS